MRRAALLCCVLAAAALAGCGRPGKPEAPEGSRYPGQYPNPALDAGPYRDAGAAGKQVFVDPSVEYQELFVEDKDYVDPEKERREP